MDVGTAIDTCGWKHGGGFVVVDLLFNTAPIVCGGSVFCPCLVIHYLVSFLDLQSSGRGRRFTLVVFLIYCGYQCSADLPYGAVGGSAVCDCGVS